MTMRADVWHRIPMLLLMTAWSAACGGSEPGEVTQPPTTGSLRVSASTTGDDVDPDGYQVQVGSDTRSLGVNGSVVFTELDAGAHAVTLQGLASNCSTSDNPRTVTVTAGSEASTSFAVVCEAIRTSEMAAQEADDSLGVALFRIINELDDVSSLDGFSFEPARGLYREALDLDPGNQDAAFGLAIATVFALEDDPDLRAVADAWDAWLDAHDLDELNGVSALGTPGPVLWSRASLPLDPKGSALGGLVTDGRLARALIVAEARSSQADFPPTPAEHQALLRDVVEPALVEALSLLEEVDDPGFTFVVTPAMQGENEGEADPLELDRTEVLVLRAGLEAALAGLDVATAYRTEPSPWGAAGFAAAMEPGSTFATLADDGAARLADAHQRLGRAVGLLDEGLDFLVAESDEQDDDVIKYDPGAAGGGYDDVDDYVGSQDVADARDLLDDIEGALAGPTVVTVDLGQGEVDLEVDLTRFFLDPIPDLKALLPDYDASGGCFRWTAATFEEWTFPDPTLRGILPGMVSTGALRDVIDLEDVYVDLSEGCGGPAVASVEVTPMGPITLTEAGATRQLTAVARDGTGAVVEGAEIRWGSSDSFVATVDEGGAVTAMSAGTVGVAATAGPVVSNVVRVDVVLPTSSAAPADLAITPDGSQVYVANQNSSDMWVISTATQTVVATVPLSAPADNVTLRPDGAFAYVGNRVGPSVFQHQISVISTSTNTVVATLRGPEPRGCSVSRCGPNAILFTPDGTLGFVWTSDFYDNGGGTFFGWRRHRISMTDNTLISSTPEYDLAGRPAITPDGGYLYVPRWNTDSTSVVSTSTDDVVVNVPVGSTPVWATMHPDGGRVYVSNSDDDHVSVISTTTNTVVDEISVGSANGSEITPDGTLLYVVQPFRNRIAVVSTVTGSVVGTIQLPAQPRSLLVAPDGSRLYLTTAVVGPNRPPRGAVHVVATDSHAIVASIPVGLEPVAAALTPDGSLLYVSNKDSGSISAISTETGAVVATIVGG